METIRVIIICIVVIFIYHLIFGDNKERFALDAADTNEAIANVASMYNAESGTLKLTNLELTGGIKAKGQIWSEAAVVAGTNEGNHLYLSPDSVTQKTTGDQLVPVKVNTGINCTGNGTFGDAFIGNSPHSGWAQFSHKSNTDPSNYSLIQHSNGMSILNSGDTQDVLIRNKNSNKFIVNANGNARVVRDFIVDGKSEIKQRLWVGSTNNNGWAIVGQNGSHHFTWPEHHSWKDSRTNHHSGAMGW